MHLFISLTAWTMVTGGRGHTATVKVAQFSDDGNWWWDGQAWVPTAQVVLPQLPPTQLAQSGRLAVARQRLAKYGWIYVANDINLAWLTIVPAYLRGQPAMRDYRAWTLEQLALATAHVLGPDEVMMAGETTLLPPHFVGDTWKRDLAVTVTARHVVIFRIDSFDGQPRWIALAALAKDVNMEIRPVLQTMFRDPALTVSSGTEQWVIRGALGVFNPGPVFEAWRQAATVSLNRHTPS
jgi:hypothetical protein